MRRRLLRGASLSRRVTLFTTLALGLVWAMAVALMVAVMGSEQEELFDQQLSETAQILLPLLTQAEGAGAAETVLPAVPKLDEALVYRLIGPDGTVLRQGALAAQVRLPDVAPGARKGFSRSADYRIFLTGFDAQGHAVQLAAPLAERREAFRESLLGFLVPMLALLPLTWLLVGWVTRRALAPLRQLRAQIDARDSSRLDPLEASDWPEDLARIAATLNGFMARLSQALEAERAFATNAAHELRNPVAIALAQVQQLRNDAQDPAHRARIEALERALQRMRRLVARLLQLARADAGIGQSAAPHDLAMLTRLVLGDVVPRAQADRIATDLPPVPVPARIDPDAYAILLGNLVENALQHGPAGGVIDLRLRPTTPVGAVLEVCNGGAAIAAPETLARRFDRRNSDGFGLGLHICGQIAAQAGGHLAAMSPCPGRTDGFLARVTLPG
ncbi:sensor histidine kinase [Gemmobacter serpentinus]|uniref:sensor histidine kinase n=1 Tax=Gemmobacter serpentinus TaxID=2652247 RepID=UPI00124E7954|nr:HAMP domain-containing sensor histidine kinase [Gemmobacter serpentinus]